MSEPPTWKEKWGVMAFAMGMLGVAALLGALIGLILKYFH